MTRTGEGNYSRKLHAKATVLLKTYDTIVLGSLMLRSALLLVVLWHRHLLLSVSRLHVLALRRSLLMLSRCHRLPSIRLITINCPIADTACGTRQWQGRNIRGNGLTSPFVICLVVDNRNAEELKIVSLLYRL